LCNILDLLIYSFLQDFHTVMEKPTENSAGFSLFRPV
jgi:hypothetical protein